MNPVLHTKEEVERRITEIDIILSRELDENQKNEYRDDRKKLEDFIKEHFGSK